MSNLKHGMRSSPEYKAWSEAKQRCHNSQNGKYQWYGARGITVCAEWLNSFEEFYAHIGARPEGYEIDRIDNNRGYEPGNVHWVTRSQNVNNRRNTAFVQIDGKPMLLDEYAKQQGISYATAWARMKKHPHLLEGKSQRKGGELNSQAKLSDDQVQEIRSSLEATKVLCEKYSVSRTLIQGIRSGRMRKPADAAQ